MYNEEKLVANCQRYESKLKENEQGLKLLEAVNTLYPKPYEKTVYKELRSRYALLMKANQTLNSMSIREFEDLYKNNISVTYYLIKNGYRAAVKNLLSKYGAERIRHLNYQTGRFYLANTTRLKEFIQKDEAIRAEIDVLYNELIQDTVFRARIAAELILTYECAVKDLKPCQIKNFLKMLNDLKVELKAETPKNPNILIYAPQGDAERVLQILMSRYRDVHFGDILEVNSYYFKLRQPTPETRIVVTEFNIFHERAAEIIQAMREQYGESIFITNEPNYAMSPNRELFDKCITLNCF